MTGAAARTAGTIAVGAVVSGVAGALLLHGVVQGGPGLVPEVGLTGAVLAALSLLAAWRVPSAARRRFAVMHLAALLPLAAVAAAQQLSWELNHSLTQVSELSWVLAAALPVAAALAAHRAGGSAAFVDAALGGAAGVGAAALFQVAVAEADALNAPWALTPWRIEPWWVLVSWGLGAAVASTAARLPPQPAARLPLGPAWRILPLAAAWIMAVIAALPAAPRHELATSAGAQALAVTLAAALALTMAVVWWGERAAPNRPWDGLRLTLRRLAPPAAALALFLIGGLQAASYIAVTMDDLSPFWSTADALARGRYPVWDDWLSLPGLPLLQLAVFSVLGYTYPAALAPHFLANVLLPWLIYRAALAAGAAPAAAFAAAVGLVAAAAGPNREPGLRRARSRVHRLAGGRRLGVRARAADAPTAGVAAGARRARGRARRHPARGPPLRRPTRARRTLQRPLALGRCRRARGGRPAGPTDGV